MISLLIEKNKIDLLVILSNPSPGGDSEFRERSEEEVILFDTEVLYV